LASCAITYAQAQYSDNGYVDVPDAKGDTHMLLVSMLTGKTVQGTPGLKEPPSGYDSVINGTEMYVVFEGRRVYPRWIITYKKA
jgi:hypothetical protein